jgi:hypothetical protein
MQFRMGAGRKSLRQSRRGIRNHSQIAQETSDRIRAKNIYGRAVFMLPIVQHRFQTDSLSILEVTITATPMKTFLSLYLFVTVASTFAADAMKFVSPDKMSTLVVDKSGRRDIIELKSGKRVHRLFYDDLDSIFKPKIAETFNASLNKIGKIVLPTFTSASWTSSDEVEIKGESSVVINDDKGDEFTFTALVLNSGSVRHLTVVPTK